MEIYIITHVTETDVSVSAFKDLQEACVEATDIAKRNTAKNHIESNVTKDSVVIVYDYVNKVSIHKTQLQ